MKGARTAVGIFFMWGGGEGWGISFQLKINNYSILLHDFYFLNNISTCCPLVLHNFYFHFSFQVSFGEMIGCDNEEVCTILHWQALHMYAFVFHSFQESFLKLAFPPL